MSKICRRDSTHVAWTRECERSAWNQPAPAHSMRRTKASLTYQRTKIFAQSNYCSATPSWKATVRYLDIEVDDALEMAEQTEV